MGLTALVLAYVATDATAGIAVGNVIVRESGDPVYIYTAEITLDPGDTFNAAVGTNPFDPVNPFVDDFITLFGLKGYQGINGFFANANLTTPILEFGGIGRPAGTGYVPAGLTRPPVSGDGDITLYEFHGHNSFTNGTAITQILGYLVFQTNLPVGVSPTLEIKYQGQIHNGGRIVTSEGTVIAKFVPEPSSLACLALGAGILARIARSRRKQECPQAA